MRVVDGGQRAAVPQRRRADGATGVLRVRLAISTAERSQQGKDKAEVSGAVCTITRQQENAKLPGPKSLSCLKAYKEGRGKVD